MYPPVVSIHKTKTGRGVFAEKSFMEGEVIEVAPTISDCKTKFTGRMRDYIFSSYTNCPVVGFGYASIYNHKNNPTAEWNVKENETIEIKALKNISKGDEIFVSYGDEYWRSRGVKPK
jgi:hypothetical protein